MRVEDLPDTPRGRGHGRRGEVPCVTLCCARCGASFARRVSEVRRRLLRSPDAPLYCSDHCARAGRGQVRLVCAGCGQTFARRLVAHVRRAAAGCERVYCSRLCAVQAQTARNRTRERPDVALTCAGCGTTFRRSAAQVRHKRARTPDALDFCSMACLHASPVVHAAWSARRRAFWQDPARRQAAAARRVVQMAAGVAPSTSRLESRVADALRAEGLAFAAQVPIHDPTSGRVLCCADFVLADGRVLEVYGAFWHCDPRVYSDGPVAAVQQRVRRLDRWKAAMLARLGVPRAVLWEREVLADAAAAVRSALDGLGPGPAWLVGSLLSRVEIDRGARPGGR